MDSFKTISDRYGDRCCDSLLPKFSTILLHVRTLGIDSVCGRHIGTSLKAIRTTDCGNAMGPGQRDSVLD